MNYTIRELRGTEYPLLKEFLYEAIFVPEGMGPPPRSILDGPELQVYISGFGTQPDDRALCAEVNGTIVGAVWVRIMDDYGHRYGADEENACHSGEARIPAGLPGGAKGKLRRKAVSKTGI